MAFNFKTQIQKDLTFITTHDVGQFIVFTPPIGSPVTVAGYASKHALKVNDFGFVSVNSKKATVTVMEQVLIDAGYTTRNIDGVLMTFAKHLVTFTDVSNTTVTYIVQDGDCSSNESVGLLTFILGNFKTATPPARTIYGWKDYKIYVNVVETPNPLNTQIIGNGDTIFREYALNEDGTLTVPYLISVPGIQVLTPFMLNNNPIAAMPYDNETATFDASTVTRGFRIGNMIAFNASLPIYLLT